MATAVYSSFQYELTFRTSFMNQLLRFFGAVWVVRRDLIILTLKPKPYKKVTTVLFSTTDEAQ